jgi:hypothetical protein
MTSSLRSPAWLARAVLALGLCTGLLLAAAAPGRAQGPGQQRARWPAPADADVPDEADLVAVGLRFSADGDTAAETLTLSAAFAGEPAPDRWVTATWRLDAGLGAPDANIDVSSTVRPDGTATEPTWDWGDGSPGGTCGSASYDAGGRELVVTWPTACLHDLLWVDLLHVSSTSWPCEPRGREPVASDFWAAGGPSSGEGRVGPYVRDTSPAPWDADPQTTERIAWTSGSQGSILTSRTRFPAFRTAGASGFRVWPGGDHATLARHDVFADALAASGLGFRGPLLLTPRGTLTAGVRNELQRVLEPGATVYLLGGEQALSTEVEARVRDAGFQPRRLAGPDRIATAVAIAREATADEDIANLELARAFGPPGSPSSATAAWADAVAGRMAANPFDPVLLTASGRLDPRVRQFLAETARRARHVQVTPLGGRAALSDQVLTELRGITGVTVLDRVAGSNRFETAVAARNQTQHRPRLLLVNGEHPEGWWQGLLAGDLAADLSAALLYVRQGDVPAATATSIGRGCTPLETAVVGTTSIVSDTVRERVRQLNRKRC